MTKNGSPGVDDPSSSLNKGKKRGLVGRRRVADGMFLISGGAVRVGSVPSLSRVERRRFIRQSVIVDECGGAKRGLVGLLG